MWRAGFSEDSPLASLGRSTAKKVPSPGKQPRQLCTLRKEQNKILFEEESLQWKICLHNFIIYCFQSSSPFQFPSEIIFKKKHQVDRKHDPEPGIMNLVLY